jgi:UDPglucose 6-dehydrogenase
MIYNIAIIGSGYVGLVSGTCFANTGNYVVGVDIDENKVKLMTDGISPIYEPGLEHLMKKNIKENRLSFTTDLKSTVLKSEIIFLCLPTPPNEDGSADLDYVLNMAGEIANILKNNNNNDHKILVNKSTVPVGTAEKVRNILDKEYPNNNLEVVSNPEFLAEGYAVEDALKPDRVVIGTRSERVVAIMKDLYEPFLRSGNPIYFMDEKSAEVTKYAANSFLAIKISFMNDLARYAETVGADVEKIRDGIGSDSRIGKKHLYPGLGYGGSCFPKDVKALVYSSQENSSPLRLVQLAQEINNTQIDYFLEKLYKHFDNNLEGKTFAIWGLAFKPNTDDVREAPAFAAIDRLLAKGAKVNVYDPEAIENTKAIYGDKINYTTNPYECANGCDSLLVITEWLIFRNPDFNKLAANLKNKVIFDGRNLYDAKELKELGFNYYSIGRRPI